MVQPGPQVRRPFRVPTSFGSYQGRGRPFGSLTSTGQSPLFLVALTVRPAFVPRREHELQRFPPPGVEVGAGSWLRIGG